MLEVRYSMIGSLFSLMVQPAADARQKHRSAQTPAQLSDPADLRFRDAARRCFLAFLLNGQQALFDGVQRDGMDGIAQGDASCILR